MPSTSAFKATAWTLILAAGVLPEPVSSQVALIPQVGLYAAVSDLGSVQGVSGIVDVGEKASTLAYGLGLDMGYGRGASLRLNGMYASGSAVPVDGIGCDCEIDSKLLALTGSLILRPLPKLILVRPYLIAGGGLKRYNFETRQVPEGFDEFFEDDWKWAGQLGLGVELDLGGLRLLGEISNYFNRFEPPLEAADGEYQHDFFFTVGLVLGGRGHGR